MTSLTTGDGSSNELPLALVCRAVISETPTTKSYVFGLQNGEHLAFDPGQFMNFTFMTDGRPHTRCYSISSSAGRDALIAITVKKVSGGLVSNWLFDHLRVGDQVRAEGPVGLFTPGRHPSAPLLLLSAGSGITPVASMIRTFADRALDVDVVFLHFARSPEDIVFRDEMASWAKVLPRARVTVLATRPAPGSGWVGPTGRLSPRLLEGLVPDVARRALYCCGPQPFMAAAKTMALDLGVAPEAFHEESFASFDPAEEIGPAQPSQAIYDLEFSRSRRTVPCPEGTTVVKAAHAAKLRIQTSCGKGICGTCRVKLLSGKVDMKHNGGIKQREIDQGWILACCSRPLSNLVIDK